LLFYAGYLCHSLASVTEKEKGRNEEKREKQRGLLEHQLSEKLKKTEELKA